MIACLILYHPEITSLTKSKLLRMIFHAYDMEIHVLNNHTVMIFVEGLTKKDGWQTVALLESTNISTGYGFSIVKRDAEKRAWQVIFQLGKAYKQQAYREQN